MPITLSHLLTSNEYRLVHMRSFQKGEALFHEGQECHEVCFLVNGKISIASSTLEGNEVVYNVVNPGEMFGNHLAFSTDTRYRGDVHALSDGRLEYVFTEDLLHLLSVNRAFLTAYLREQSEFGKSLNLKIKLLGFASAEERFFYYLHSQGGSIAYSSVASLAQDLFLARETLSRLLSRMEEEGKVSRQGKTIRLL